MFIIVVLPHPDGPMTDTNSPSPDLVGHVVHDRTGPAAIRELQRHALERDAHGRTHWTTLAAHAIRSCHDTNRRATARSARSIASAMNPMQMIPT